MFQTIQPWLSNELLAALSSLLSLLNQIYLISSQDLEGNENDDELKVQTIYPLLLVLMNIFMNLVSCPMYRDSIFPAQVIETTKALCSGSATLKTANFILSTSLYAFFVVLIVERMTRLKRHGFMPFLRLRRTLKPSSARWGCSLVSPISPSARLVFN